MDAKTELGMPPPSPEAKQVLKRVQSGFRCATCTLLLAFPPWQNLGAQEQGDPRIFRYTQALSPDSGASPEDKLNIIKYLEQNYARSNSSLITSNLFYACNAQMERNPKIRESAARALGSICDLNNIMHNQRLARMLDPFNEPAPAVRMAVLDSLAKSPRSFAADKIRVAAQTNGDPDAEVRRYAQKLLEENPTLLLR